MGLTRRPVPALFVLVLASALGACSTGEPRTQGVWSADDGSGTKTIGEDGSCSGMYYADGEPLDIGGSMTCTFGEISDGVVPLVVRQPPNEATYTVTFVDDDTMRVDTGTATITLTRQ